MHDLQLVGFTTDRRGLIFRPRAGARTDVSFVVPVTGELIDLITQIAEELVDVEPLADQPRVDAAAEAVAVEAAEAAAKPRSQLSVRDIQARLRAGEPVARVAAEAGAEEEWIERFAPPIRAEQRRIVDRALEHHLQRSRSAPSAAPLRRAVGMALADKGIAYTVAAFEAAWSAHLLGHDRWAVEFTYRHRGRDRTATWTYDVDADTLTTTDRTAAQLGYVAPGRAGDDDGQAIEGIIGDPDAATQIGTAAPVRGRARSSSAARPAPLTSSTPARSHGTRKVVSRPASTRAAVSARRAGPSRAAKQTAGPAKKAATSRNAAAAKNAAPKKTAPSKKAAPARKAVATSKKPASKKPASKKAAPKKPAPKKAPPARKAAAAEKPRTIPEAPVAAERAGLVSTATSPTLLPPADPRPASPPPAAPVERSESVGANGGGSGSLRPGVGDALMRLPDEAPRPTGEHRDRSGRPVAGRPGEVPIAEVPLAPRPPFANGRAETVRDLSASDPASARRARAAERSISTVQFRSGSASPVRAAGDQRVARPSPEPQPDPGDDRARQRRSNGVADPTTRRRRQLRGR